METCSKFGSMEAELLQYYISAMFNGSYLTSDALLDSSVATCIEKESHNKKLATPTEQRYFWRSPSAASTLTHTVYVST